MEYLTADGFEQAFIGLGRQAMNCVAIYDYDKCVKILMNRDAMSYDEATEFMDFNVLGAYVGIHTPVFIGVDYDSLTTDD